MADAALDPDGAAGGGAEASAAFQAPVGGADVVPLLPVAEVAWAKPAQDLFEAGRRGRRGPRVVVPSLAAPPSKGRHRERGWGFALCSFVSFGTVWFVP